MNRVKEIWAAVVTTAAQTIFYLNEKFLQEFAIGMGK